MGGFQRQSAGWRRVSLSAARPTPHSPPAHGNAATLRLDEAGSIIVSVHCRSALAFPVLHAYCAYCVGRQGLACLARCRGQHLETMLNGKLAVYLIRWPRGAAGFVPSDTRAVWLAKAKHSRKPTTSDPLARFSTPQTLSGRMPAPSLPRHLPRRITHLFGGRVHGLAISGLP